MSRYLYGASVQGIQDFIFKTNNLQEIVGASEIVKSVAGEFLTISGYKSEDEHILINTAGNIKAIFETKEACEKVVLEFGKIISQKAYGITLSQAVVEFDAEAVDSINQLEQKLKTQRNKPSIPLDMSINIMRLNPKTAKPAIKKDIDIATKQKLDIYNSIEKDETYKEFKDISNGKNKLAVIHIDGNGLGKIVKKLGKKLSRFSINLDIATRDAFNIAKKDKKTREIIIGGDDVTVICNADDALSFTKEFLQNFEIETKKIQELNGITDKLTACAGIAYCNEKYPFHYAVDLAEALCGVAKNRSKRKSSCLMFHNIQSSNYQSWDKFVEDELTISDNIRCDFGAYYLDNNKEPSIKNLIIVIESLRLKDSPSSKLRNWLSELYKSEVNAQSLLNRIDAIAETNLNYSKKILNQNFENLYPELKLNNLIINGKTPIYDILQILSITEAKGAN